jgi:hypothetical protein
MMVALNVLGLNCGTSIDGKCHQFVNLILAMTGPR